MPHNAEKDACQHEWTERGSGDLCWRECWLCGEQTPYSAEKDAPRLCPECLGLGGWPCNTGMPHYVLPPEELVEPNAELGRNSGRPLPPAVSGEGQ